MSWIGFTTSTLQVANSEICKCGKNTAKRLDRWKRCFLGSLHCSKTKHFFEASWTMAWWGVFFGALGQAFQQSKVCQQWLVLAFVWESDGLSLQGWHFVERLVTCCQLTCELPHVFVSLPCSIVRPQWYHLTLMESKTFLRNPWQWIYLTISSFDRDISTKSYFRFAASFSGLFPTCWENSLQASETSCPVVDYDKHGIISGYSTQCVKEGTSCPCGKNSISCPDPNDAACHREVFFQKLCRNLTGEDAKHANLLCLGYNLLPPQF